jgi:hypothetical protein
MAKLEKVADLENQAGSRTNRRLAAAASAKP